MSITDRVIESATLHCNEGGSDKLYVVSIVEHERSFMVKIAYGRRGGSMHEMEKTSPTSMVAARKVMAALIKEKNKKGYKDVTAVAPNGKARISPHHKPAENTGAPVHADHAEIQAGAKPVVPAGANPHVHFEYEPIQGKARATHCVFGGVFFPQLLNPIEKQALDALAEDPRYVMQEKIDGERRLVCKDGTLIRGINRQGFVVPLPPPIVEALSWASWDFLIDGEEVGDVLHVFDLLTTNRQNGLGHDLTSADFLTRFAMLQAVFSESKHFSEGSCHDDAIRLVKVARTVDDKRLLIRTVLEKGGEGIVIRDGSSPYGMLRPASGGPALKYKFNATATAVVLPSARKGKRSVAIGLFDDLGLGTEAMIPVGHVTIPANHDVPTEGALIEVRYLYAFRGGSLFQPVYLGERRDIDRPDGLASLKYKNESAHIDNEEMA